jgi:hypothetical protein
MPTSTKPAGPAAQPPDHDIDAQVRELLAPRKGEWERIADASGVVSYSWISKFMNDKIPGSRMDTLRNLRAWLRANPDPIPAPTAADAVGTSSLPGAASEPPA